MCAAPRRPSARAVREPRGRQRARPHARRLPAAIAHAPASARTRADQRPHQMLAAMVARAMAAEPSPARRGSGAPAVPTLAAPARAVSDVDSAAPPPVAVAHSADGARAPLVRALSGGLSGRLSGGLSGAAPPFDEDLAVVRGCDEVYENQWLAHASHAHQRAAADGGVARSTRRSHEATRPLLSLIHI